MPRRNKAGLKKKKIRGKDGVLRTYWVRNAIKSYSEVVEAEGSEEPVGDEPRAGIGRNPGRVAAIAVAAASATALAGYFQLRRGIQSISVDTNGYFWPKGSQDAAEVERRYSEFEPGDLIERCFIVDMKAADLAARHYAVYMGRDSQTGRHMVVHARANDRGTPIVAMEEIDAETTALSPTKVRQSAYRKAPVLPVEDRDVEAGAPVTREEILDRARFIANQPHSFDVLKSNCESVARGIIEGEAVSYQGQRREMIAQVGGTLLTELVAKKRWDPQGLSASQMTTQANRLTLYSRGLRGDGLLDGGQPLSPGEAADKVDAFTGSIAREVQVKFLAEWLESLFIANGGEILQGRIDAKGVKCGKSYIPPNKKCKKGLGKTDLRNPTKSPVPTGIESSPQGSAIHIANKKGLLSDIAVNKEDFDWPGNGVITPEIEKRYSQLKKGDLIENAFLSQGAYVRHYGVYGGRDKETGKHLVYQVARKEDGSGQTIKREPMDSPKPIEFSAWRKTPESEMYGKENTRVIPRSEIIKRAEATVGKDFHYNTFRSNCEHYARGVVEGRAYSVQADKTSPFLHVAGDLISVGIRKKVTKNGMTAQEIISLSNEFAKKEGRSLVTDPNLYLSKGKKDSDSVSFGELKSPIEFEADLKEKLEGTQGAVRRILEEEAYTNYFMMLMKGMSPSSSKTEVKKDSPSSKKGLIKKKIRGKDGVTRTYWIDPKKKSLATPSAGLSRVIASQSMGELGRYALKKAVGGAAAAAAAHGMKKLLTEVGNIEKSSISEEEIASLEFTSDGMPTAETYSRYDLEFEQGDLIRKSFQLGGKHFYHYAVYAGKNEKSGEREVYQVGVPGADGIPNPNISKDPIHRKEESSPSTSMYERVPDDEMYKGGGAKFSREEILLRAEGLVGHTYDYKITRNNCESLARLIVEGDHYTTQGSSVSESTKKLVDSISTVVINKSRQGGGQPISPAEASSYLEALARREGEPFLYSDFILKSQSKKDSMMESGLIPLSDVISLARESGSSSGTSAKRIEAELISRYLLLLSTMYGGRGQDFPLTPRSDSMSKAMYACEVIRADAGKGKKCPGGYTIASNKNCRKGKSASMKTPGRGGKAALVAGGLAAAGAAAAGGAALAYKHRDKIIAGVDKAGEKVSAGSRKALEKGAQAYAKGSEKVSAGVARGAEAYNKGATKVVAGLQKGGEAYSRGAEKVNQKLMEGAVRYGQGAEKIQGAVEGGAAKASAGVRKVAASAEGRVEKAKANLRTAIEKGQARGAKVREKVMSRLSPKKKAEEGAAS